MTGIKSRRKSHLRKHRERHRSRATLWAKSTGLVASNKPPLGILHIGRDIHQPRISTEKFGLRQRRK